MEKKLIALGSLGVGCVFLERLRSIPHVERKRSVGEKEL